MINDNSFFNALETMDIEYFRQLHPVIDEDIMIMGLHKARYDCRAISQESRLQSAEWLRSRDYGGIYGVPLAPVGQLPV